MPFRGEPLPRVFTEPGSSYGETRLRDKALPPGIYVLDAASSDEWDEEPHTRNIHLEVDAEGKLWHITGQNLHRVAQHEGIGPFSHEELIAWILRQSDLKDAHIID